MSTPVRINKWYNNLLFLEKDLYNYIKAFITWIVSCFALLTPDWEFFWKSTHFFVSKSEHLAVSYKICIHFPWQLFCNVFVLKRIKNIRCNSLYYFTVMGFGNCTKSMYTFLSINVMKRKTFVFSLTYFCLP